MSRKNNVIKMVALSPELEKLLKSTSVTLKTTHLLFPKVLRKIYKRRLSQKEIDYYSRLVMEKSCPKILLCLFIYLTTEHRAVAKGAKKDYVKMLKIPKYKLHEPTPPDVFLKNVRRAERQLELCKLDDLLRKATEAIKTNNKTVLIECAKEFRQFLKRDYKTGNMSKDSLKHIAR